MANLVDNAHGMMAWWAKLQEALRPGMNPDYDGALRAINEMRLRLEGTEGAVLAAKERSR